MNRQLTDEERKQLDEASLKAMAGVTKLLLDEYRGAHSTHVALGMALAGQGETCWPRVILALAMFEYAAKLSVCSNFELSEGEYEAAMDIARSIAKSSAAVSKGVALYNPKTAKETYLDVPEGARNSEAVISAAIKKIRTMNLEEK